MPRPTPLLLHSLLVGLALAGVTSEPGFAIAAQATPEAVEPLSRLRGRVEAAWLEFDAGHWRAAAAAARDTLASLAEEEPAHHAVRGDLLRLLATCHAADPLDAVAAYDAALAAGYRDAEILAGRGRALRILEREAEAIVCFDDALLLRPGHADTLLARGLASLAIHANDDALADLTRAVRADPGNARHQIALAAAQTRLGDMAAARMSLHEAITLATAAGQDCRRGEALAELRRWKDAVEAQTAALGKDPHNLEALALRSAANARLHDGQASRADAREIAERDPGNAGHWLRIGDIERERLHDLDAALAAYSRGLTLAARSVPLLVARGRLLSQRNDYDAAAADFNAAEAAVGRSVTVCEARAAMLTRRRDFRQALVAYDRLVRLVPGNPRHLADRAGVHRSLGDDVSVRADFDAALAAVPPRSHAVRAAIQRDAKRWPESLAAYTAAIQADPGNPRLLHDRAWVHNETEAFKEAAADCRAGLTLDPDDPDLHEELAFASKGLGDLDTAIRSFTTLLDRNPAGDSGLYAYRGEALMARKDYAAAAKDFARARDLDPRNPIYHDWLGASHRELGDLDKALECFDEAIRLDPRRAHFQRNRGWVLLRQERCGEAFLAFDRAIALQPQDADGFYWRGVCLEKLGDFDGAERDLAEAVRLAPDDSSIREAFERVRAAVADLSVAASGRAGTEGRHPAVRSPLIGA